MKKGKSGAVCGEELGKFLERYELEGINLVVGKGEGHTDKGKLITWLTEFTLAMRRHKPNIPKDDKPDPKDSKPKPNNKRVIFHSVSSLLFDP